uniref:Uncharacterized protein n=1 Tax=Oryza glumipatula TaxID=40148 RepID=A0A0E0BVS4_9ORYZ
MKKRKRKRRLRSQAGQIARAGDDPATPIPPLLPLRLTAARAAAGKAGRPQGRRRRGSSLTSHRAGRGAARRDGGDRQIQAAPAGSGGAATGGGHGGGDGDGEGRDVRRLKAAGIAMVVGMEPAASAKVVVVVPCGLVVATARCPAAAAAVSPRSAPLGRIWRVAGGSWRRLCGNDGGGVATAAAAVGDGGGGRGSWRLRCRLAMAVVVHMASGGGQPHAGEGRRHSGSLRMRGLASVAAATAAVCGGGGDVGGGEELRSVTLSGGRSGVSLLPGLCDGYVAVWVVVYFFLFPGYDPSGL